MNQEQQPANAQPPGSYPGGNSSASQPGMQQGMQQGMPENSPAGGMQQGMNAAFQTTPNSTCSHDSGYNPAPSQGANPGNAGQQPQAAQPGNGSDMSMGGPQPQGHAHLLEHITGQPSNVGMMAAGTGSGYTQPGQQPSMQPGPYMGQPHFSHNMPGAAPYQGSPMSGQTGPAGQTGPMPSHMPGNIQPPSGPFQTPGAMYGQTPGQMYGQTPGQGFDPGYGQQPHPGQQPGNSPSGMEGQGRENRYGELYGLINEAANGNADVNSFVRFFQNTNSDFWKGALVGTALTLLLTNDAVKSGIARGFSGIWDLVGSKAEEMEAEEDRKAEKRMSKED